MVSWAYTRETRGMNQEEPGNERNLRSGSRARWIDQVMINIRTMGVQRWKEKWKTKIGNNEGKLNNKNTPICRALTKVQKCANHVD